MTLSLHNTMSTNPSKVPPKNAISTKATMGKKHQRGIADMINHYQSSKKVNFKPENFTEISRIFGPSASIDMNRLVCQHQQHVASAYMRRIRRDKIKQRDVYFNKLQNIPLQIRRMAVGPDYIDPYSNFKQRLPKLGQDNKIRKALSPNIPLDNASPYVPHNSLAPHINVLFKMNPGNTNSNGISGKGGKAGKTYVEDDLPYSLTPRKSKAKLGELPQIKKRISTDGELSKPESEVSVDNSPRCPTNTPRNAAFWSFNIPNELDRGDKKSHVSSIPKSKEALAAISSVQKYNKPLPSITSNV